MGEGARTLCGRENRGWSPADVETAWYLAEAGFRSDAGSRSKGPELSLRARKPASRTVRSRKACDQVAKTAKWSHVD
ncbi:hypothetical protein GCM10018952_62400 [Streptosporangium vulgare]